MSKVAHDAPSTVVAHHGEVHVDGPGCTALAMTPNAAIETADRLLEAAVTAHGQRILAPVRNGHY